jgi:hypothetical protein
VINSHLTFPHAEIYKDMRLDQIKLVLAQARDYIARENLDNVPVVRTTCLSWICGAKDTRQARRLTTPGYRILITSRVLC